MGEKTLLDDSLVDNVFVLLQKGNVYVDIRWCCVGATEWCEVMTVKTEELWGVEGE